ncbi:MAG: phosphodiester glycosidase family protein [Cyanobacteria bacterium J06555_13]
MFALFGIGVTSIGLSQSKTMSVARESTQQISNFQGTETSAGNSSAGESAADEGNDAMSAESPTYRAYDLMQATVHVVTVPLGTPLSVASADELATVEEFAQQENALAVINAGFFDPQNSKTTSHITIDGQLVGNPADNERLVSNPDLQDYLPQILDRSEFRIYQCEFSEALPYDIVFHSVEEPQKCTTLSAVGAGPQLLPDNTATVEAFTDYEEGDLVRDAIGSVAPNARSAIALKEDGSIMLFMVAQRSDALGMTLLELAEFAESLEATELLNLDGGSSSALYYEGQIHLGRLDANGNPVNRPVKSVIIVGHN